MMRFWAILLGVCYNLVSLGATLQVHTCGNDILWSISESENPHDSCPLCHSTPTDSCHGNSCQDLELKLDQLSDQLFANNKDTVQLIDSAIIVLPWIQSLKDRALPHQIAQRSQVLAHSDSSPPIYILHCTFRI